MTSAQKCTIDPALYDYSEQLAAQALPLLTKSEEFQAISAICNTIDLCFREHPGKVRQETRRWLHIHIHRNEIEKQLFQKAYRAIGKLPQP